MENNSRMKYIFNRWWIWTVGCAYSLLWHAKCAIVLACIEAGMTSEGAVFMFYPPENQTRIHLKWTIRNAQICITSLLVWAETQWNSIQRHAPLSYQQFTLCSFIVECESTWMWNKTFRICFTNLTYVRHLVLPLSFPSYMPLPSIDYAILQYSPDISCKRVQNFHAITDDGF